MSVQPTPPIQLDPSMDTGHQLAFINQNFNNIANVIGQNSFVIVGQGNYTTVSSYVGTNPGAGLFAFNEFLLYQAAHNLPFVPTIQGTEEASSAQYTNMPLTKYSVTGSASLSYTFKFYVDASNFYIYLSMLSYGNGTQTISPGFIFKWYLQQQTST